MNKGKVEKLKGLFDENSLSKVIPPAKKILPPPIFIGNNAGNISTGRNANNTINNDSQIHEDTNWRTLERELLEFIKKTEIESMKEISEEALAAVEGKDSNKLKKILAGAGKVGLEIFSKASGTVLPELAKKFIFE